MKQRRKFERKLTSSRAAEQDIPLLIRNKRISLSIKRGILRQ
jgi:hypothetical protein